MTSSPAVPAAATPITGSTAARRLIGAAIATAAAAPLLLATWMTPSDAGLGTHEQLSLPQCGWVTLMDLPCPTCGMTTAFTHAADGDLITSFLTQPLGAILALGTAMALLIGLYVAVTGSQIAGVLVRLWRPRTAWLLAGVALAAWIYKMASYKGLLP